ncbi:MAG: glycosyltransferase family 2 protein [Thermoanaerobaculia bacterium]|nr:glycosyltransferase family 2 protein [Thermoanaerobaculia bacterium]
MSTSPLTLESPSEVADAGFSSLDVSVLVPVLDEEGTVGELATRVATVLTDLGLSFEIIFIDDGSKDGTVAAIREAHQRDGRVHLVALRRNFGKASALSAGFDAARGDLVVTMDGDLQDHPEEIPRLLAALEAGDFDLVSGWKKNRRDPASKRYPSKLYNWVTRRLAKLDLHDFNCGFKVYRREVLEQVAIYGELHRYIPVLANEQGFRVGEIDVEHHPRTSGVSKYGWDRFYKGLLDLITVLFITRYGKRPLHLFGVVGLTLLGAGFVINGYLAVLWLRGAWLSNRPLLLLGILLMVMGIQILTTGLLGEMITFKNFKRSESYSIREVF